MFAAKQELVSIPRTKTSTGSLILGCHSNYQTKKKNEISGKLEN
jgi:hypothetical protein